MVEWYREDLAYIHDVGFSDYALESTPSYTGDTGPERDQGRVGGRSGVRELRGVGFRVRTMRSYGRYSVPRAHAAFVARKPA
jgi:hypothetical protein